MIQTCEQSVTGHPRMEFDQQHHMGQNAVSVGSRPRSPWLGRVKPSTSAHHIVSAAPPQVPRPSQNENVSPRLKSKSQKRLRRSDETNQSSSTSTRFPKLSECAHFHYDTDLVDLGVVEVSVSIAEADLSPTISRCSFTTAVENLGAAEESNIRLAVRTTNREPASGDPCSQSWVVYRDAPAVAQFDTQLHTCVFDRAISRLPELRNVEELINVLEPYFDRFSDIASSFHCVITCAPVLNFLEMDNRGRHLVPCLHDSAINTPAVAAAHAVQDYEASALGELTLKAGDIISVIDHLSDPVWWRGKNASFEVGLFPCHCVELIDRQHSAPPPREDRPVLRSRGGLMQFLRTFFLTRPSRRELKKRGILKERVFGCDLAEYLQNACLDVPLVLRACAACIETHGIVNGIYRHSGVVSNTQQLRCEFDEHREPDLSSQRYLNDIHAVGSLLKMYFRELPNPLFTFQLYDEFVAAVQAPAEYRTLMLHSVVMKLPPPHFRTAEFLMKHLARMAERQKDTSMNIANLAIVWGPNLLRSQELEPFNQPPIGAPAPPSARTAGHPTPPRMNMTSLQAGMMLSSVSEQALIVEHLLKYHEMIFSRKLRIDPHEKIIQPPSMSSQRSHSKKGEGRKTPRPRSMMVVPAGGSRAKTSGSDVEQILNRYEPRYSNMMDVGGGPAALPPYHTVINLPPPSRFRRKNKVFTLSLFGQQQSTDAKRRRSHPQRHSLKQPPAAQAEPQQRPRRSDSQPAHVIQSQSPVTSAAQSDYAWSTSDMRPAFSADSLHAIGSYPTSVDCYIDPRADTQSCRPASRLSTLTQDTLASTATAPHIPPPDYSDSEGIPCNTPEQIRRTAQRYGPHVLGSPQAPPMYASESEAMQQQQPQRRPPGQTAARLKLRHDKRKISNIPEVDAETVLSGRSSSPVLDLEEVDASEDEIGSKEQVAISLMYETSLVSTPQLMRAKEETINHHELTRSAFMPEELATHSQMLRNAYSVPDFGAETTVLVGEYVHDDWGEGAVEVPLDVMDEVTPRDFRDAVEDEKLLPSIDLDSPKKSSLDVVVREAVERSSVDPCSWHTAVDQLDGDFIEELDLDHVESDTSLVVATADTSPSKLASKASPRSQTTTPSISPAPPGCDLPRTSPGSSGDQLSPQAQSVAPQSNTPSPGRQSSGAEVEPRIETPPVASPISPVSAVPETPPKHVSTEPATLPKPANAVSDTPPKHVSTEAATSPKPSSVSSEEPSSNRSASLSPAQVAQQQHVRSDSHGSDIDLRSPVSPGKEPARASSFRAYSPMSSPTDAKLPLKPQPQPRLSKIIPRTPPPDVPAKPVMTFFSPSLKVSATIPAPQAVPPAPIFQRSTSSTSPRSSVRAEQQLNSSGASSEDGSELAMSRLFLRQRTLIEDEMTTNRARRSVGATGGKPLVRASAGRVSVPQPPVKPVIGRTSGSSDTECATTGQKKSDVRVYYL